MSKLLDAVMMIKFCSCLVATDLTTLHARAYSHILVLHLPVLLECNHPS